PLHGASQVGGALCDACWFFRLSSGLFDRFCFCDLLHSFFCQRHCYGELRASVSALAFGSIVLIVFDLHGDQCRSGLCCRPGEQILRLPVGDWSIVDQEAVRSEEHTSELQSREKLVCRLLLEKKKI